MDIIDLLDKLEEIGDDYEPNYPEIYIQIGDMQAPLRSVKYFHGSIANYGAIVLSSNEEVKLIL